MHAADDFLQALTIVLGVAAVMTVLCHWLRQPVVLGYIVSGLIIGPFVPVPLVADPVIVHTLSELGVILLMFSLGLEFSLRKLLKVGPTAGVTAVVQCSVMIWLGFAAGRLMGWTTVESLFAGAIVAISSTTIIAKAFDEQGIRGSLREIVVGVLIVEDLIAILLMATLTAVATGSGLSAGALAVTVGRLAGFLIALVVVGLLIVPRVVRAVVRIGRAETTLVTSIGICFGIALLAHRMGYSVALGAFIAGSLVAESGESERVEQLIHPVRDVFAAIFFVSVGMLIDPTLVARHWSAVVVFTVLVVLGKVGSVTLGAFLTGNGTRTSLAAGMSMAQIGEFSFIIAGLGLTLGVVGDFLYPVAVAVSAITTLVTPWLIRAAGPAASFVDRRLPRPLQTFVALYGSWFERIRNAPRRTSTGASIRRLVVRLLLDAAIIAALVIGASIWGEDIAEAVTRETPLREKMARAAVIAVTLLLSAPFALGLFRIARRLGLVLGELAMPPPAGGALDRAAAPRRAFVITLQIAGLLLAGVPIVAITQPFMSGLRGAWLLLLLIAAFAAAFWRSAANLHGHVRAGAELVLEMLAAQSAGGTTATASDEAMRQVHQVLPGIGDPALFALAAESPAIGRSLAELDLRGITGATVIAITRTGGGVLIPTAREVLRAGDVLALAGTLDAIDGARALLAPPAAASSA